MMIANAAFVTAVLTLAVLRPSFTEAGNEANALTAAIQTPKLTAGGVEISIVAAEGQVLGEGEEPVFELRAVNTTDKPAAVDFETSMTSIVRPVHPNRSRMPALPRSIWTQEHVFTLSPRETRTFTASTKTKLPAESQVNVLLRARGTPAALQAFAPAVVGLSFSTVTQPVTVSTGISE
jgi:hypothetical protein